MSDSPQLKSDPINLSERAAEKVRELLMADEGDGERSLRVGVRGGGCSGFEYALAFDGRREDDHVFEHRGVEILVDPASMRFVYGSLVDWVDGLQGAGFKVENPNVVAACGCGSSFQVREDSAATA
jgi:iron-sulfur cluster assembly protein